MAAKNNRECWKQVWADGRAVAYVRELAMLEKLKKKHGRWWAPVGKPTRVVAPKGVRIR